MKYKIIEVDKDGKITFTKEELEKLLDDVYNDGFAAGKASSPIYVKEYPEYPTNTPVTPTWDWNKVWCDAEKNYGTTSTVTLNGATKV